MVLSFEVSRRLAHFRTSCSVCGRALLPLQISTKRWTHWRRRNKAALSGIAATEQHISASYRISRMMMMMLHPALFLLDGSSGTRNMLWWINEIKSKPSKKSNSGLSEAKFRPWLIICIAFSGFPFLISLVITNDLRYLTEYCTSRREWRYCYAKRIANASGALSTPAKLAREQEGEGPLWPTPSTT